MQLNIRWHLLQRLLHNKDSKKAKTKSGTGKKTYPAFIFTKLQ